MVSYVTGLKMSHNEDAEFPNTPRLCQVQWEIPSFYRTNGVEGELKKGDEEV